MLLRAGKENLTQNCSRHDWKFKKKCFSCVQLSGFRLFNKPVCTKLSKKKILFLRNLSSRLHWSDLAKAAIHPHVISLLDSGGEPLPFLKIFYFHFLQNFCNKSQIGHLDHISSALFSMYSIHCTYTAKLNTSAVRRGWMFLKSPRMSSGINLHIILSCSFNHFVYGFLLRKIIRPVKARTT